MKAAPCWSSAINASTKRTTWSSTALTVSGLSGTALGVASAAIGVMTSGGVSWKLGTTGVATVGVSSKFAMEGLRGK